MAYPTPFDPTTPTDASWAHEGDDEIRKIKQGLIERFAKIFTNFPDGDPLVFRPGVVAAGVSVGQIASRPEFPTGVGVVYLTTDSDQLFFGVAAEGASGYQWKEFRPVGGTSGVPTVVLTPTSNVVTAGTSVAFVAAITDPTGSVSLGTIKWFSNGVEIAGSSGKTSLNYTVNTTSTVRVEYTSGKGVKATAESTQTTGMAISQPQSFKAVDASTCTATVPTYAVDLTWVTGTVGADTKVYKSGVHLTTIAAGGTSYRDLSVSAAGNFNYEVEHTKGATASSRVPASVLLADPCATTTKAPKDLRAVNDSICIDSEARYAAMVSWINTEPGLSTRLYRDGELIATLAPGIASYGDSWDDTIVTAVYSIAYIQGDSTDGPVSNTAYVKIDRNPCNSNPRGM